MKTTIFREVNGVIVKEEAEVVAYMSPIDHKWHEPRKTPPKKVNLLNNDDFIYKP